MSHTLIGVDQKPAPAKWIALSFQHVFAMFGATVLVPLLTGLEPSVALFTSGCGTLLYIVITKGKVPAYLGSSFAFIPPLIAAIDGYGIAHAMGATLVVGIFYAIVAGLIRLFGKDWIGKVMSPVVIGSVIIVIGLKLAPVAMDMAMNQTLADGVTKIYQLEFVLIAAVTLSIAVISSIVLKGFFNVIPILIALVGGYIFTLIMGISLPETSFALISFDSVINAPIFGLPKFVMPQFDIVPIVSFVLVSFATVAEHLGDTLVTSKVVGKDFYKDPGLHRTLLGDGVATSFASFWGGPPNTTYGENIGVMAITHVYSVWVIGLAAVFAVVLSFFPQFGALIGTMPVPVLGGVSMMLFGIIASAGIRTVVESGVDYTCKRNLTISSVILVIGIGGGKLLFPITEALNFELADVALATLLGIILNLILPPSLNRDLVEEQEIAKEQSQSAAKDERP